MKQLIATIFFTTFLYATLTVEENEHFLLDSNESFSIVGDVHITNGATLNAGDDSSIYLSENWINDGLFRKASSKVHFIGETSSTILGESEFYDFISKKDTVFESDKTQKITNHFLINNAFITSTIPTIQAILDLSITQKIDLDSLNVKDNKIIGRIYAINPKSSIDSGNNILWFSTKEGCQDISISDDGFKHLLCKNSTTDEDYFTYIAEDNNSTSNINFNYNLKESINTIVDKNTNLTFIYKNPNDIVKNCDSHLKVILHKDTSVITGFESDKGCNYIDHTLQNWDKFKDGASVEIKTTLKEEREKHDESQSVIILDINLTSKMIIGGNDEK